MTNEELVAEYQNGRKDAIFDLWKGVYGFTHKVAQYRIRNASRAAVDLDDLMQESYLALVDAAETYKADGGKTFIGWYYYFLKSSCAKVLGYRTAYRDACDFALSIDVPISEDDDTPLGETIADDHDDFAPVDERLYFEKLHEELEKLLHAIPEDRADALRKHYFDNLTVNEIAAEKGVEQSEIRKLLSKGRQDLFRKIISSAGKPLWEYDFYKAFIEVNTPYYLHVGVSEFNTSHASAVERIVMLRESMEKNIAKRQ